MPPELPRTQDGEPDYEAMIDDLVELGVEPGEYYRNAGSEVLYLYEYHFTDVRFGHVPRKAGIGQVDIPIDELWIAQQGDQPLVPVEPRFVSTDEVVIARDILEAIAGWADPKDPKDDIRGEITAIVRLLDCSPPH